MKMANYENTMQTENSVEKEQNPNIPIVDMVRHGRTAYKELDGSGFEFDPEADGFKLDSEHLDLTEEGIEDIENAARQLVERIDRENEVVILTTSPNFRARSSILIMSKILQEEGIKIMNSSDIMEATKLRQLSITDKKNFPLWLKTAKKYDKDNPDNIKDTPDKKHVAMANSLDLELEDLFNEDYEDIDKRFESFFRHMSNIYKYLKPETKEKLEGKTIRVIALTHEEVAITFLKKTLDIKQTTDKGQILELRANDFVEEGQEVEVKVKLLKKPGVENSQSGETTVSKKFTLE